LRQMRVSSRASGIACGPNDVRYASVLKALRIVGVVALVLFVVNVLLVLKIVFFSSSVAEGGAGNSRSEFKVDLEGSSR